MKTSTTLKFLAVLAVVAGGAAFVWSASPTATVAAVKRGRAVNAVSANVTVIADYALELRSEVGGRVAQSALVPGQHVAPGDFLAQLDPGDLDLEIAQLENDLAATRKRFEVGSSAALDLANAQATLAGFERLAQQGEYPPVELEKQRRIVEQFAQKVALEKVDRQAQLDALDNALKVKHRQRGKMRITSPLDGIVTEVAVHVGDIISGSAPLATIIASARRIEARVSEENFAGIREGQPVTVRFLSYGPQAFAATVGKIFPTADPATQRHVVELNVKIAPELLVPGLTGNATVLVAERPDALIIPRRALAGGAVLVVADERVALRKVTAGFQSLNEVEILDGLKEGEQVIVEEMSRFKPGQRVRATLER